MASLTSSPGKDASSTINILLTLPFALNGTSKDAIIRSLAAAAELAIDQVNNRTDILPDTRVNVIRVNTWDPAANAVWKASNSGGYAFAAIADAMASMPGEERKKPCRVAKTGAVAGIIGDFFSRSTMFTGEAVTYFTKPFCGASQGSTSLSDKNNYPYFFRMQFAKGEAAYVLRLLKEWRVTRVAVLLSDDALSVSNAADLDDTLSTAGLSVTSIAIMTTMEDSNDFSYPVSLIKSYDLHYIFVAAAADMVGSFYTYAFENGMVSSNYVYLSYNPPFKDVSAGGAPEEYAPQAYDCAMVMLNGFDQLLKKSPSHTPSMLSDGSLADRLNFTAFVKTGYAGLSWNPLTLNHYETVSIDNGSALAYVVWALMITGIATALAAMIFSAVQAVRSCRVLGAGMLFSMFGLLGIMVLLASFPFFIGEMTLSGYQAQLYLPLVGFGILFGAISAKSAFITRSLKNKLERRRGVGAPLLITSVFLAAFINAILVSSTIHLSIIELDKTFLDDTHFTYGGIIFAGSLAFSIVTFTTNPPAPLAAEENLNVDVASKVTGTINNEASPYVALRATKAKSEFSTKNLGMVRFQYRGLLGWTTSRLAALTCFHHPIKKRFCLTFVNMEDPIGFPKTFNLSTMRPQDDLLSHARARRPTMISPAQTLSRKSTRDSFRAGATAKVYPSDYTNYSTGGPAIPAPSLSNWSSRETLLTKAGSQSQQLEEHRKRADVEAGHSTKLHLIITTARDEVRILVRDPSQYDALQAVLHAVAAENEKTQMIKGRTTLLASVKRPHHG
ncbi:hypothetical protein HK101_003507 [Irineochytrium annulatum]|nr:hypothetical protein HK101_003507 [Irineochytrium annulatum]